MITTSLANLNHLEAGMGLHGHQGSSGCVEVADGPAYYRADVSVLLFNISIPHICHFFTQAKFLENKINTEKRVNYDKLHSKLPIFRVKSVKIYTGQFFLTQTCLWCL